MVRRVKGRRLWVILSTALFGWILGIAPWPQGIVALLNWPVDLFSLAAQNTTTWSDPIIINKGGKYTGYWRSTNPDIPAVKVETSEPVTIQGCMIESAGDGIYSLGWNADLTIISCYGKGLNPNILKRKKGNFINIGNFAKARVENNTIESSGQPIRILNYGPKKTQFRGQFVRVRYNVIKNIDARPSDGQGNYLPDLVMGSNAIGLNTLISANVEIAWNQVINQPFVSLAEDVISTYGSSGTSNYRINIHDNYLQGGYTSDPSTNVNYSGTMINVGDQLSPDVGYVHVYNNQIVSFENSGILISAGHNNEVDHNRVISAQKAVDGAILGGNYRSGLVFWDYYKGSANGYWHDNNMHDNSVNVVYKNGNQAHNYIVSAGGSNTVTGTTNPWGHVATQSDELAEYQLWSQKVSKASVRIGCRLGPICKG